MRVASLIHNQKGGGDRCLAKKDAPAALDPWTSEIYKTE